MPSPTTPTQRLYFGDPCLTGFSARVVGRGERNGRPAVALDRSAFYPEGGGQPADHGMLNEYRVLDVQSDDRDVVWHLLDRPMPDDEVQGQVDWGRRFDHMQQHHGQHLLSAAFEELFDLPTVAFHLGNDYATIDLAGEVTEEQLLTAEQRTNEVIWEDRPIEARFVTAEELAALPLRKPPVVEGPVRVVSVPEFDHSACGGTHPRRTGAVGLLHVRRRERRGADTRVEFVCGGRALRDLRWKTGVLGRIAVGFTVGLDEVEGTVQRLRELEESSRKRLAAATERLLGFEAGQLLEAASGSPKVVVQVRDDLSLEDGRTLARAITALGGRVAFGLRGPKSQLLVARPEGAGPDCGGVVREALRPMGGKGGGGPTMAQGGVPDAARLDEVVASAAARLADF
jgi:alanyl-tRNA synthetase